MERLLLPLPGWWRQLLSSQRREVQRVVTEVMATRGMMPLLMKARNGGQWTPDERRALIEHLRRVAHLSPLIVLLLPGSVMILPAYAWWLDRRRLRRQD